MAKQLIGLQIILVVLLFLCGTLNAQSPGEKEGQDDGDQVPWKRFTPPREPWKGYYNREKRCIAVLTNKCGAQIFDYIFNRRPDVDISCCEKLIEMGELCSKQLSYTLSHVVEFEPYSRNIYNRSEKTFQRCKTFLANPPSTF